MQSKAMLVRVQNSRDKQQPYAQNPRRAPSVGHRLPGGQAALRARGVVGPQQPYMQNPRVWCAPSVGHRLPEGQAALRARGVIGPQHPYMQAEGSGAHPS